MHLIIDIGNSKTKAALFSQRNLLENFIFEGFPEADIIALAKQAGVQKIIVSSVKNLSANFQSALQSMSVLFLSSSTKTPLTIEYKTPNTIGVDRIAAAVGASCLFPNENVLCFDLGSCITTELVTADKVYKGGSISPGMSLRFKAMHTFTDKLPLLAAGQQKLMLPGDSTEACMVSGVVNGIAYEIKGMIENYESQFPNLKVIFTGGDAAYFESLLNMNIFVEPKLVLKGLNEILLCNVIPKG